MRDVSQDSGERNGEEEEDRGEPGGGEEPQVVYYGGEGGGNGGGGGGRGRSNKALTKQLFMLAELGDLETQHTILRSSTTWPD